MPATQKDGARGLIKRTLLTHLLSISRDGKRGLMVLTDVSVLTGALWGALALKQESPLPNWPRPVWAVGVVVFVAIGVFARFGLYRAVIRFISPQALAPVAAGATAAMVAFLLLAKIDGPPGVAYTTLVIFWIMALLGVGGVRYLARSFFLSDPDARRDGHRVLIYGAGSAGVQLASALRSGGKFIPLAFVDDNESLHRTHVGGIEVVGPDHVKELVDCYGISRVLLALPSASRTRRKQILATLEPIGVRVQTVPDVTSILTGAARVDQLRDIDPADLLGRDPVPPDLALLDACIRDKVVLITGAGGSIGSELCRQIVRECPKRLLLLEMSEYSLYQIHRELEALSRAENIPTEIVALLGNAHHRYRIREILSTYGVQTVYHAAAYKHVPIVERNLVEGVHNNIFSTWHTAEAALDCGVEVFVLVSTDKAVNPTNVMGATKRFSEIVLQGMHQRGGPTRFCMVRFGNVLESSGSVVPLFREQIERGGPVTVTHPEVTRYFMTIPEAAQLVVQASSMAKGGDVFVLDMGRPIRISDLARRMIQLYGLTVRSDENPDGDIEIAFTGLRSAEKLYEELLIGTTVMGTEHPMIMRAIEHALPWSEVAALLEQLAAAMRRFDCKSAMEILSTAVREYRPSNEIQDLIWRLRVEKSASGASENKVADLTTRLPRQPTGMY